MSDLIDRADAIRIASGFCHPANVAKELAKLPAAEPEIIRCKDCRKHNVSSGYKKDCCALYEWRGMSYGHEHDYQYCSHAERREE